MSCRKCQHPGGVDITLLGQEFDPCRYVEIERHDNVNVIISRCPRCGAIDISWERTFDTVDYVYEEADNGC